MSDRYLKLRRSTLRGLRPLSKDGRKKVYRSLRAVYESGVDQGREEYRDEISRLRDLIGNGDPKNSPEYRELKAEFQAAQARIEAERATRAGMEEGYTEKLLEVERLKQVIGEKDRAIKVLSLAWPQYG